MPEQHWFHSGEVKPRNVSDNPRCPECKDGPMFYLAHPWGRAG